MYRFFCSVWVFVATAGGAWSQEDSVPRVDSARAKIHVATRIRAGLDLSRLFMSATQRDFLGAEGSLDININQWIYEAHLGYAAHSQRLKTWTPESKGLYASIGMGRNVFADNQNILSFGGRLAASQYSFQPTAVQLQEPQFDQNATVTLEKTQNTAIWLELVGSMKAQIFGWMLMGFDIRIKPRLYAGSEGFQPYAIPGYGLYQNQISYGFNYFVFVNLPTRK